MRIAVQTLVQAEPARVWEAFTTPADIVAWNFAVPEWHCPRAAVDLRVGGLWSARMEARDGSFGFDFEATLEVVEAPAFLRYRIADGRTVEVRFVPAEGGVRVEESFEAEGVNDPERQRAGWQAILDNFRLHVEGRA